MSGWSDGSGDDGLHKDERRMDDWPSLLDSSTSFTAPTPTPPTPADAPTTAFPENGAGPVDAPPAGDGPLGPPAGWRTASAPSSLPPPPGAGGPFGPTLWMPGAPVADPRKRHSTKAMVGIGIVGFVVGVAAAIGALVALVLLVGDSPWGHDHGTYHVALTESGPRAGRCYAEAPSHLTFSATQTPVDCTSTHRSEVIGLAVLPDLRTYPGSSARGDFLDGSCGALLRDYVGSSPDDTDLDFGAIFPDEGLWRRGERTVVCVVGGDPSMRSVRNTRG